jgi:diaminopimelate epimerase
MNGAGNDFVVLDNRTGRLQLSPKQIAHLCDRHRSVGAAALLHHTRTNSTSPIAVTVRGGGTLHIEFQPGGRGSFRDVTLRGAAEIAFQGEFSID